MDTTVVISRSYLDHLLRTSLNKTQESTQDSSQPNHLSTVSYTQQQNHPVPSLHYTQTASHTVHSQQPVGSGSMLVPGAEVPQATTVPVSNRTQANSEDYYPFGRPGCGAPLRTDTGQVMADLRQRAKLQTHTTQNSSVVQEPHHMATEPPAMFSTAQLTTQHLPQETASMPSSEREGGGPGGADLASPRYARGAGPHVNQYVLREKEEKRRKELEHVVSHSVCDRPVNFQNSSE